MANVHSRRLFSAPGFSGGPTAEFTCPAGVVCSVKCVAIVWGDVAVSGLDAWVMLDDLTKLTRVTLATGISPSVIGGRQLDYGMWVLNPAESLSCQTATGTCDFYCSGFLLDLP